MEVHDETTKYMNSVFYLTEFYKTLPVHYTRKNAHR